MVLFYAESRRQAMDDELPTVPNLLSTEQGCCYELSANPTPLIETHWSDRNHIKPKMARESVKQSPAPLWVKWIKCRRHDCPCIPVSLDKAWHKEDIFEYVIHIYVKLDSLSIPVIQCIADKRSFLSCFN